MPTGGTIYTMASSVANRRVNGGEKVGCSVCGATNTTLFKQNNQRICRKCRNNQMNKTGGDD